MKRGFTLIELVVVLGIFGILMVAGTEFFIQVIKNGNQATMQNEVRQEANKIMQDIVNEARKPGIITWTSGILTVGSGTTYSVNTGTGELSKNGAIFSSRPVAVLDCTCGTVCTTSGLTVSNISSDQKTATVTLTVQQKTSYVRSDFCAKAILTQTITSRVY